MRSRRRVRRANSPVCPARNYCLPLYEHLATCVSTCIDVHSSTPLPAVHFTCVRSNVETFRALVPSALLSLISSCHCHVIPLQTSYTHAVCGCKNGSPKTGSACTVNCAEMCQSCNTGFIINSKQTACVGSYNSHLPRQYGDNSSSHFV